MNPTLTQITFLNTFIKSDIATLTLTPPKIHVSFFSKIKNDMPLLKHSKKKTTFHQFTSFTNNLYLLRYRTVCASLSHSFTHPKYSNFAKSFFEQLASSHRSPSPRKLVSRFVRYFLTTDPPGCDILTHNTLSCKKLSKIPNLSDQSLLALFSFVIENKCS